MTLKVYTKPGCTWCEEAKSYLQTHNIPFNEANINADPGAKAFLIEQGHTSVPVAYHFENGSCPKVVGGYREIMSLSHE